MRNSVLILTLSILMAFTFAAPSLTEARWKTNSVVNQTTDPLYVVYSTWYGQSQGLPRGYRTRGYYKVDPGNFRTFQAWANNAIYFQIWQSGETLKPKSSTETFSFWVHPSRAFVVVSPGISETVTPGQLTHSRPGRNTLVGEDGFMRYANGSELKVNGSWVRVSGIGETDPGAELSLDVNNDGVIDASDVAFVASRLNQEGTSADVNGDGRVTVLDVQLVTDALGTPVDVGGNSAAGDGISANGVTDANGVDDTVPSSTAGMVLIPAGEFRMGSNDGAGNEKPVHSVYVDAFYMDKYEVTNAQYAVFLNAKGKHAESGREWIGIGGGARIDFIAGKYQARGGYENHPVVYVSWYGAMAYAAWSGKRLPTEAEWEKAARGSLSGLKYPWGNTIDSSRANYKSHIGDTTAVGKYTANGYGLYDVVGNVWEWCLDEYNGGFYSISPARNPLSGANSIEWILDNYTGITSSRVVRGGSWAFTDLSVRVAYRNYNPPARTDGLLGFRCARTVSP